jgi:hypothetical protein
MAVAISPVSDAFFQRLPTGICLQSHGRSGLVTGTNSGAQADRACPVDQKANGKNNFSFCVTSVT